MNPATPYPPTLNFETGVPQVIALKYPQGKPCRNGQSLMFTTVQGDRFFVHPVVGAQITQLGIQPGEPFEMTRGRGADFQVRRIAQAPTFPARHAPQPSQPTGGDSMSHCYTRAVDIALGAVEYAKTRGLVLSPSFEDVRALAATLCISEQGRR